MIKGFFITTWRNFRKNKAFSLLNIIGLAIGIACAGIILLWVEYYTTYNHAVKNLDRIYQMENAQVYGKDTYTFAAMPFAIRTELQNNFPDVETVVRYSNANANVALGDRNFTAPGAYVDPEFLKMFSYDVIRGNAQNALAASVGSVVKLLTRSFISMVLLACIIAFPIAFYLMDQWLTGYEYRISIQWYVFAITALITSLIAFITVSFQAFKAGRLNTVKAIKSE